LRWAYLQARVPLACDPFERVSLQTACAPMLLCPGFLALASLLTESERMSGSPCGCTNLRSLRRVIGHILAACSLEPILFMDLQRHLDTFG
jgi:hypothetical protein